MVIRSLLISRESLPDVVWREGHHIFPDGNAGGFVHVEEAAPAGLVRSPTPDDGIVPAVLLVGEKSIHAGMDFSMPFRASMSLEYEYRLPATWPLRFALADGVRPSFMAAPP